jgi:hypothetical protein
MSDIPDAIVLKRDRDLKPPRQNDIWIRRGFVALVCIVPLLALFNVFGQRSQTSAASVGPARFSISSPARVRGGLLFQSRFRIDAKKKLDQAILVLDRGWLDGLTINTIEPSPTSENSENGKLSLDLGTIPAGQSYVLFVDVQVNPTTVGRQDQTVTLYDGNRALITLHRTLTVFP